MTIQKLFLTPNEALNIQETNEFTFPLCATQNHCHCSQDVQREKSGDARYKLPD